MTPNKRKPYIVLSTIAIVIITLVCTTQKLFSTENTLQQDMMVLCNAFTVVCVFIGGLGGLFWASNEGGLDAIAFGFKQIKRLFTPKSRAKKEFYYDFVERRREKRINVAPYLIIGGISLLLSVLFYIVYTLV